KKTFKFVVYSAFVVALPLITRVLNVCGYENVYSLHGSLTADARRKCLSAFHSATGTAILIMTSVGVTGLNLQDADVMVLLDANWSGSFDTQLVGRVYRQGQVCRTICYRLISMYTADYAIILIGLPKELANSAVLGDAKNLQGQIQSDDLDDQDPTSYLEEVFTSMDRLYNRSRKRGMALVVPRPPLALSTVPPQPVLSDAMAKALQRVQAKAESASDAARKWQPQVEPFVPVVVKRDLDNPLHVFAARQFDSDLVGWTLPSLPVFCSSQNSSSARAALQSAFQVPLPTAKRIDHAAFLSTVNPLPGVNKMDMHVDDTDHFDAVPATPPPVDGLSELSDGSPLFGQTTVRAARQRVPATGRKVLSSIPPPKTPPTPRTSRRLKAQNQDKVSASGPSTRRPAGSRRSQAGPSKGLPSADPRAAGQSSKHGREEEGDEDEDEVRPARVKPKRARIARPASPVEDTPLPGQV
ncbi:hypothetical protein EXIGLDRAFT_692516, partial [Exidia glandulosa HHB12029]